MPPGGSRGAQPRGRRPQGRAQPRRRARRERCRVNPTGLAAARDGRLGRRARGRRSARCSAADSAPREAAVAGAWLHGAAADLLAPRLGDAGLLAHEVADAIPRVRAALRWSRDRPMREPRTVATRGEAETEALGERLAAALATGRRRLPRGRPRRGQDDARRAGSPGRSGAAGARGRLADVRAAPRVRRGGRRDRPAPPRPLSAGRRAAGPRGRWACRSRWPARPVCIEWPRAADARPPAPDGRGPDRRRRPAAQSPPDHRDAARGARTRR